MKKIIIAIIAMSFFCNAALMAQDQFSKRSSIIKAFVTDVFKKKKTTSFIVDNYMYLAQNDTISKIKKEGIITAMIDTLIKNHGDLLTSSNYEIFAYEDFKGIKKDFNIDNPKDIMILTVKNKPAIYFYFNQEHINSFFTIEKGSLSFFVTI